MLRFSAILLVNFLLFKTCRSSGTLHIFLSKYNNTGGKLADGSGCDWDSTCEHYFEVCVDQPNGSLTDMGQCSIGEYQTEYVANRNQIDFRQNIIHENPKILPFNVWQGGFTLKVRVWDRDIQRRDDLVELLSKKISIKTAMSRNAMVKTFVLKKRTQLTIQVLATCDASWFGPRCDCQPSSNASGHYYCNTTTGDKICNTHWYGPNCTVNCRPGNGTRQDYDCGADGRKICLKHWYGSECDIFCRPSNDTNGHFECAPNGGKICHKNWYGSECTKCCWAVREQKNCNPGFDPKVAGSIIAVLVLIIFISLSVNIWKVCQGRKQHVQQSKSQVQGYEVGLGDIEPYYVSQSASAQPMTDDNPYSDAYSNLHRGGGNTTYVNQAENVQANTYLELLPA